MYLIIGLGNPEEEYSKTRHNMGFNAINKIAEKYEIEMKKTKFNGIYGSGNIEGEKVILIKPQTYMNLSGKCVKEFLEFYKQHCLKKEIENMDNYETIHDGDFVSKNLDTVLALIKEQQEELDKKDKQIDLMARAFKQDDVRTVEEIKQYFAGLVERGVEYGRY